TGDVTTDTEWAIATADEGITGEWKLPDEEVDPDKETLFRYSQRIETDSETGSATQYLGLSLNEHFFNVRANSLQLARQGLWNTVEDRISWNVNDVSYLGPKSPFNNYSEQYSAWFKAGYRGMSADDRNGYDMDAFNMAVGVDCAFEEYFAAGAFFHYGNPELKEDHETASADNYSVGIYAGYKMWGGFELKGMLGYTFSDYSMERNMTDFGKASTSFRGSALSASLELARPFFFNRFVIRPIFAVDTECVWQDEAIEQGSYALMYRKNDDTWTYARMGAKLDFSPNDALILKVKGFYAIQLDDSGPSKSEAAFVSTRDAMECVGAALGDHYFNVGASLSWMITDRVTLFGGYDGYFSGDSSIHSGNGGIQFNF
ncbi:MAG: autotransporter outer membrane beta-barrel domain-containing protein, partial [Thermoguttaceae bacterium]|nr:autotransporter outer membrane beta-barrel domain-containing protein [Thermoguttaceae bacterium]